MRMVYRACRWVNWKNFLSESVMYVCSSHASRPTYPRCRLEGTTDRGTMQLAFRQWALRVGCWPRRGRQQFSDALVTLYVQTEDVH